jgi:hypothetical protein
MRFEFFHDLIDAGHNSPVPTLNESSRKIKRLGPMDQAFTRVLFLLLRFPNSGPGCYTPENIGEKRCEKEPKEVPIQKEGSQVIKFVYAASGRDQSVRDWED